MMIPDVLQVGLDLVKRCKGSGNTCAASVFMGLITTPSIMCLRLLKTKHPQISERPMNKAQVRSLYCLSRHLTS